MVFRTTFDANFDLFGFIQVCSSGSNSHTSWAGGLLQIQTSPFGVNFSHQIKVWRIISVPPLCQSRTDRQYFRKCFFHLNEEGSLISTYLISSRFCATHRSTLLLEPAETAVASVTTAWLLWSIFMFSISTLPCSPFPLRERHTFCLKSSPILRRHGLITADATLCPQFHFSPGGA